MNQMPIYVAANVETEIRQVCDGDKELIRQVIQWLPSVITSRIDSYYQLPNPFPWLQRDIQAFLSRCSSDITLPDDAVWKTFVIKNPDFQRRLISACRELVASLDLVKFYAQPAIMARLRGQMETRLITN